MPHPSKASLTDPRGFQLFLAKFLTEFYFLDQFLIHRNIEKIVQRVAIVLTSYFSMAHLLQLMNGYW